MTKRGTERDVHERHFCTGTWHGSESKLAGRYRRTMFSMPVESGEGDSSGTSMMVMTRQSEELWACSPPPSPFVPISPPLRLFGVSRTSPTGTEPLFLTRSW